MKFKFAFYNVNSIMKEIYIENNRAYAHEIVMSIMEEKFIDVLAIAESKLDDERLKMIDIKYGARVGTVHFPVGSQELGISFFYNKDRIEVLSKLKFEKHFAQLKISLIAVKKSIWLSVFHAPATSDTERARFWSSFPEKYSHKCEIVMGDFNHVESMMKTH